jgi:preprotein translocase subunit SecF
VVQQYGEVSERRMLIRLPQAEGAVEGNSLEQASTNVEAALQKAGLPKFTIVNRELVSAIIGHDLQLRGIYATLASLLAITVYIGIRFRFSFAVGAIVATLHDVLVTLAFLVFFNYDLSLNVVAAILTITGYSVNDTIVIFDRVRENLRSRRREPLDKIVNESVNQTLSRTIITAGTTFLSVLSIFLFGGEALRGFSFTMLVGIVSGTYSTIFIASAIAIILSGGKGRAASAAASSGDVVQGGKKQKRAKAS